MPKLLIIDDDRAVVHLVRQAFTGSEVEVRSGTSAAEGLEMLARETFDVVLLDVVLPGASGLETFERFRRIDPKLPIIFITAGGTSDTAIEAMKMGAYDYVLKPLDLEKLRAQVEQAVESRRLMSVPVGLPDSAPQDDRTEPLVGRSPQMLEVYKAVGRVASQDVTVLITGESGTGKELIARAIYHHSARSQGPFLAVNCAALPDSLLESELFGHEKGAFTGAERRRIGKFEQCQGGTIFLDEIGDMSPLVQAKVLRLLQQQEFERVGGNETIRTDVRIIVATNRDLEAMVGENEYREDLYYRLNGFAIHLPPLRERKEDIPTLVELFLGRFARQMNKSLQGIAPSTLDLLMRYGWPGNVRELQNVLRKALLHSTGAVIAPETLPRELHASCEPKGGRPEGTSAASDLAAFLDARLNDSATDLYAESLAMMEGYLIARVLRTTGGNQSKAARILGITRASLRNKIHSLGITIGQVVQMENDVPEEPSLTPT
jgi:two-component system nitrogen regulation response regulator GlnG